MIDSFVGALPLGAFRPLRAAIIRLPRRHPVRMAATLVLQRAARANRCGIAGRLTEVRPLDAPHLSFEAVNSMVVDALYWFGVRGYEGVVTRVWAELCKESNATLEVGGNIGLFSVLGAKATLGSYTVVEPVPAVARVLRLNLFRNGCDNVEVIEGAAAPGESAREVVLTVPDEGRDMPVGAHLGDISEVSGRASTVSIAVAGYPFSALASGRDLIKIDAEGVEAALLADVRPMLVECRPTLLVEVLPEAAQLGALLSDLARQAGYGIYVLPEYGSDEVVPIEAGAFTSSVPQRHRSKDVVLSTRPVT